MIKIGTNHKNKVKLLDNRILHCLNVLILSMLLIKSDLKSCIHLSRSLFSYSEDVYNLSDSKRRIYINVCVVTAYDLKPELFSGFFVVMTIEHIAECRSICQQEDDKRTFTSFGKIILFKHIYPIFARKAVNRTIFVWPLSNKNKNTIHY